MLIITLRIKFDCQTVTNLLYTMVSRGPKIHEDFAFTVSYTEVSLYK